MITVDDLQIKRTPEELGDFVKNTFELIRSDVTTRKVARQRKRPYKELIEEVYPLSVFCVQKYHGRAVLCYPVIGNQGYDAKIEKESGELVEIIELTWPIDGQKAHFQAIQLNENGHTELEIRDVNDSSQRNEIIERIIIIANKKALKDYSKPEGSSLIFVLDTAPYFGMHQIEHQTDIDVLTQRLKNIKFKVSSVYLLLLPIGELVQIK